MEHLIAGFMLLLTFINFHNSSGRVKEHTRIHTHKQSWVQNSAVLIVHILQGNFSKKKSIALLLHKQVSDM